ncbi:hypothetical protein C8Q79DRAFT_974691 [Trametes meyenii]|nr:hypothetical protein C8Q79DRAFT_974691 [Trametes meyenii]
MRVKGERGRTREVGTGKWGMNKPRGNGRWRGLHFIREAGPRETGQRPRPRPNRDDRPMRPLQQNLISRTTDARQARPRPAFLGTLRPIPACPRVYPAHPSCPRPSSPAGPSASPALPAPHPLTLPLPFPDPPSALAVEPRSTDGRTVAPAAGRACMAASVAGWRTGQHRGVPERPEQNRLAVIGRGRAGAPPAGVMRPPPRSCLAPSRPRLDRCACARLWTLPVLRRGLGGRALPCTHAGPPSPASFTSCCCCCCCCLSERCTPRRG